MSGERVPKDCITLRVVGELDELNSLLGLAVGLLRTKNLELRTIIEVQKDLFKLGSEIASIQELKNSTQNLILVGENNIQVLENEIDKMWAELPELKNFILPGGSGASAHLHLARTVCRRAERELVFFGKEKEVRKEVYQYLNRLSDFLFAVARYVNFKLGEEEEKV